MFGFVLSIAFHGIVYDIFHALFLVVLLGIGLWMGSLTLYYSLTPAQKFLNGVKFAIRCFPVTLLFELGLALPFYLVSRFVNDFLLTYLLYGIIVFVLLVPLFLAFFLYSTAFFDRFINKEKFPDYYRKGLGRNDSSNSDHS